jgi:hypothetical protein
MAKLPLRPHRYWINTTCPGNLWQQWVPGLREMDTAPIKEDDDMPFLMKKAGNNPTFISDSIQKWGIPSQTMLDEMIAKGIVEPGVKTVSTALFNRIKTTSGAPLTATQTQTAVKKAIISAGSTSGLTIAQIVAAVKQAQREGTG